MCDLQLDTTKFRNYIRVRVRLVIGLDLGFRLWLVQDTTVYCSNEKHMSYFLFSALTLLAGRQEGYPACNKLHVGLLVVMI